MATDYILLIDDDEEVLGTLSRALSKQGYEVQQASSGEEGLKRIKERIPDLLILDIIMPTMDGLEVCQTLRGEDAYNRMPILFLSARTATDEVVEGLDVGGDDYIVKPFEITELNARVRALMRRSHRDSMIEQVILEIGEMVLDSGIHQLSVPGKIIQLTSTEHRLLRHLMEHVNEPMSPSHLLQEVWSYPPDTGDPDLVRAHIRNLRAKIEPNNREPKYIRTIHSVGYMVSDDHS
jgi:two-component system, OmpR family, response regulator RpaA